jgi:hypothetical protein
VADVETNRPGSIGVGGVVDDKASAARDSGLDAVVVVSVVVVVKVGFDGTRKTGSTGGR